MFSKLSGAGRGALRAVSGSPKQVHDVRHFPSKAFWYDVGVIYWDNGKENGNYYSSLGLYIGIMEKKMETTIVHWGNIGIMEKKMETTIVHWGCILG